MEYTTDQYMNLCTKELKERTGIDADQNLLGALIKHMGIAARGGDASLVACDQDSERETIKESFLIGKLKLSANDKLDAAIEKVCQDLGHENTQKYRGSFYYLLVKHYGKSL